MQWMWKTWKHSPSQCQVAFLGRIFSRQTMHSDCPATSCWVRRSFKLWSTLGTVFLPLLLDFGWEGRAWTADRASWPSGFPWKIFIIAINSFSLVQFKKFQRDCRHFDTVALKLPCFLHGCKTVAADLLCHVLCYLNDPECLFSSLNAPREHPTCSFYQTFGSNDEIFTQFRISD